MTHSPKGILYLVPVLLGETPATDVLPQKTIEVTGGLKHFIAENAKSARSFLKMVSRFSLQDIDVKEIDKHSGKPDYEFCFEALRKGFDTGLLSEAGMPGVADPGAEFVLQAHREKIRVVPLTGPSSILLALSASGLNGQGFAFHGYLPKEQAARIDKLKLLERMAMKDKSTQIFIETPYRNQPLLQDILKNCNQNMLLCIASGISTATESIRTMTLEQWKKSIPDINKIPTVFLLL